MTLPLSLAAALLSVAALVSVDDPVESLAEWPQLSSDQRNQVELDVQRLRKANTDLMAVQARAGLLEVGAGAVPALLIALDKERDAAALGRVRGVLVELTGAAHTRLLAREFEHKSLALRVFALTRSAAFPDPGLREAAERALAQVRAWQVQKSRKFDADELYAGALACAAAGSIEGFDVLIETALARWSERGDELRTALAGARGAAATARVAPLFEGGERLRTVAALNLLAGCGAAEQAVPLVKPLLDESDNQIRIAAINALRGIVDGEPPISKLSVFDAIELARKWKARV